MVKVEKFIKSTDSKSKARKLAGRVKNIQALDSTQIGIKTYKEHLVQTHQQPTQLIPKKLTRKSSNKYVSKLGLNKVSKIPIPQQPTKLDLLNMPIIQPGNINIPTMELIEVEPNIIRFDKPTPLTTYPTPITTPITEHPAPYPTTHQASNTLDDYIIVIPSYNRPEIIQSKTLGLLNRHNINPNKITIFVANQEQYDLYKAKIPAMLYGKLIVGVLGLKNQRNYIMNYYPEGTHIVQMDDDLDKIVELVVTRKSLGQGITKRTVIGMVKGKEQWKPSRKSSTRKTVKPISNLDEVIRNAFKICKEKGIYLWGVYPLSNPRFMTPKVTTDLRFIVGPMWGNINRHRQDLQLTIDEKENAERTLQHWVIDNKVLRFNGVGIETKYYKNKGGMQNEGKNRKEEALKSVYYLHKKYPQLTKIYLGKKSGVPEIKMGV